MKLHWLVWVLAIVAGALAAPIWSPTAASVPNPAPSPEASAFLIPPYATTFESLTVNGRVIPIKGFYLASPTPKPTLAPDATPTPKPQAPPQTPSETPASAVGFNCGVDQSEPDAFNVWVGPKPCADFWADEAGPYVRAKQFFAALGAKIVRTSDPSTQKAMFEYNRHDLMGGAIVANSPALQKIGAGQYFWPGPYHGPSPANIDLFGEGLITVSYCKHTFTGPYRMNKDQMVLGKANVDPYAWALAMNFSVTYHPVINLWGVGYLGAFPDAGLNGTDSTLYTITPSDGTYGNGTDPDVDVSYGQGTMGVTPNAKQLARVEQEDGDAAVPFYVTITGPKCGKPKKHKPYYVVHMTSTITETVNGGTMTGTVDADVSMAKKSGRLSVMRPTAMNSQQHPKSLSDAEAMMNGTQGSVPSALTAQGQGDLEYHASVEHFICSNELHTFVTFPNYESGAATFLLALPSGRGTKPYLIVSISKGPQESLACGGSSTGRVGGVWASGFVADHVHDMVMPNPFSGGSLQLSSIVAGGGGIAIPLEASYGGSYKYDISRDVKTGSDAQIHDETEITVRKCSAIGHAAFC